MPPVRAGDTITTEWKTVEKEPKPNCDGGIITLEAICTNQYGKVVAEGKGKILVSK